MLSAGIDVGSITAKCAVIRDGGLLGSKVAFSGYALERSAQAVFQELLQELAIEPGAVDAVVATGYGRRKVSAATKSITEITCHAAGAAFLDPCVRTVIDIGGQDCKAISLNERGKVLDFVMNDKCAAGTGRFLEVMARALELDLEDFGDIALSARSPARISSTCTVFAESEVISLISGGASREDILAGLHRAIADRIAAMAGRISVQPPGMLTGGVAKNSGVVRALEERLQLSLQVTPLAQVTGALGAAVLAAGSEQKP